jgi:hypothetical protein
LPTGRRGGETGTSGKKIERRARASAAGASVSARQTTFQKSGRLPNGFLNEVQTRASTTELLKL